MLNQRIHTTGTARSRQTPPQSRREEIRESNACLASDQASVESTKMHMRGVGAPRWPRVRGQVCAASRSDAGTPRGNHMSGPGRAGTRKRLCIWGRFDARLLGQQAFCKNCMLYFLPYLTIGHDPLVSLRCRCVCTNTHGMRLSISIHTAEGSGSTALHCHSPGNTLTVTERI